MRAPPEAVTTMNAASCSTARRAAASSPSPSAQPIEPAMKSKFITAITAGRPSIRPCAASIASGLPVLALRLLEPLDVALAVAELERIGRRLRQLDPGPAALVEQRLEAELGPDPEVVAAVRADALVRFQVAVEDHVLAARTVAPTGSRAPRAGCCAPAP